jgi:predicted HD phosphohydrolase
MSVPNEQGDAVNQADKSYQGRVVGFTRMQDGTREDYRLLESHERDYLQTLPDRILAALEKLRHSYGGYPLSRLEHSLQAATRATNDGADEELVAAALIHDLGDDLAPCNHAELAAAVIRPYVRGEVTWIVEQHGLFQSYYYAHHLGGNRDGRDKFRAHRWYRACEAFCANWDQCSFDPRFPSLPLDAFEPLLRRIFTRPAHDPRYVTEA